MLISEISEALTNTKAKICFILNVVNQSTETFDYKVTDHLNAIYKHCEGIKIDTVIVNNEIIPKEVDLKYKRKSASQLLLSDEEREYLKKLKIRVLEDNLVSKSSGYSRHNEDKLARLILDNF